jgi:hypothetical protein
MLWRACHAAGMKKYGVKLNTGKVMWVQADWAEVRDGAVLFFRRGNGQTELIAGFTLAQVNHWGVPDAFSGE